MNKEQLEIILKTLDSYGERLEILEDLYRVTKEKKQMIELDNRLKRKLNSLESYSDFRLDALKKDASK